MVIKTSPSMRPGGLPQPPSFSTKRKHFPSGATASSTFRDESLTKNVNSKKVLSRFYMRDAQGNRGAVEVAYFSSSNIQVGAYNHARKTLSITFKGGKGRSSVYEYFQVPKEYWEAMKKASSVGRFFYYTIRKRFAYKRLS